MSFQKLREFLALILIGLLPFHAFLVTVGTKVILGPDHAPLPLLALWKEGLIVLIVIIALVEMMLRKEQWKKFFQIDIIDLLFLSLIVLSVLLSFLIGDFSSYVLGFKYDFAAPILFLILRRVEWSDWFKRRAIQVLLVVGLVVSAFGILSLFLSPSVFRFFGYSELHSLYQADAPLAPFQQVGGTAWRRIQSTMSGPNQLGLWLLLPWTIALLQLLRDPKKIASWVIFGLVDLTIGLTFSRSAYIAALVIFVVVMYSFLPKKLFVRFASAGVVLVILLIAGLNAVAPELLLRAESSRDHLLKPLAAIQSMVSDPLGKGLGTAGPATNRTSDTCLSFPAGADYSWAQGRQDLCIFIDGVQMQPKTPCTCPILPENWYLQIGLELGILGFILFGITTIVMLTALATALRRPEFLPKVTFFFFLGISIAGLFLHSWEDSAIAYTAYLLIAVILPRMLVVSRDREIII